MLQRFFSRRRATADSRATVPAGRRIYAIGDIHGRIDLLDELLARIEADDAARPPAETTLIFLGDLIDRGPASAAVVERLLTLVERRPETRFLLGNHEEVFIEALTGDEGVVRTFCRIGGRETVLSYGVVAAEYETLDYAAVGERLRALVPAAHRAFLAAFEDLIVIGDYAFVHAGVRPGMPLDQQSTEDLRWIRSPFLSYRGKLDKVVVHGHTISAEVEMLPHRIGIDTGAYASGRLSALGLEAADRWVLQTTGV